MGRFEGKSALVTGAASGMGRATTLAFANEGANVLAVDIDADGLATLATEAAEASGSVVTHHAAIGTRDAGHAAVAAAVEAFGGLDVLANVAGVVRSAHTVDVTEDDWNLMFSVNVSGMFWLCQAALGAFDGGGVIVNVASNAGLMGQAYFAGYCASKGAVVNLTKALAMPFAKDNSTRINALAPRQTPTPMTGTTALLDLKTSFGAVRNELESAGQPTTGERTVEIHAQTSAGDIDVVRAVLDDADVAGGRR